VNVAVITPNLDSAFALRPENAAMAFSVLLLHWLAFLIWGFAFNDSGGYLYCRVAMPNPMPLVGLFTHIFTIAGCVILAALGYADKRLLGVSNRVAFYPLPLFVITQLVLAWVLFSSMRF